jgi:hypothetical protein
MLKRLGLEFNELFSNTILSMMSLPGIVSVMKVILIGAGTIAAIPVITTILIVTYQPELPIANSKYVPSQELLNLEASDAVLDLINGQLKIDISERRLNQLLQAYIVEEVKPTYDPQCLKGILDDSCVIVADFAGFNGIKLNMNLVWVELNEDQFIVNIAISELNTNMFQMSIVSRMYFNLIDNNEFIELKFDRLQTGFLPIPIGFFSNVLTPVLESNGIPVTGDGSNGLTYSLADLTIRLEKQLFIDFNIENELLASYASLIVEENLIQLTIDGEEKQVRMFVDQERLYSQTTLPLIPGSVEFLAALYLEQIIAEGSFGIADFLN